MKPNTKDRVQQQNTTPQFEIIFGVLFIVLVSLILLNSKFFAVKNVEIKGNQGIPSEDIILNAGLNSYRNIFQMDTNKIKASILKDHRIASVTIKRHLPGKVVINVQERFSICLLAYLNNLLIIGEDGLVMGIQEETEPVELPVVIGAKLKDIKYGEKVLSSDFQVALEILRFSDDYLQQVISKIDVSRFRIFLDLPEYSRLVEVELGTGEQLREKVTNLRAILLSSDINGKLERIDLRIPDCPTVITSKYLKKL